MNPELNKQKYFEQVFGALPADIASMAQSMRLVCTNIGAIETKSTKPKTVMTRIKEG